MFKFIISLVLLIALIYLGGISVPVKDSSLPPIGAFFSPQVGFWQNGHQKQSDKVEITNLSQSSKVFIDDRGVPHIFAPTFEDAARIQGYLHAKDRLFQMDISTRFTAGRLAEIFGKRMVNTDRLMRRRGLPFAAENALSGWKQHPETYKIIEAYSEGVNSYINELNKRDYPIEYKLLNAEIEPWSPLKSALLNKSMAFDLCFRNQDDMATKTREQIGELLYRELFPFRNKKEDPIIPTGTTWDFDNLIETGEIIDIIFPTNNSDRVQKNLPEESIGSNNWAVAGRKTKNGYPILCNDPHLKLNLPSIWYEVQIRTPKLNVYGASLPGAPGVIIGFNDYAAWGVTNVSLDVLDWFKIKWIDEKQGLYELDGRAEKVSFRQELIHVKDSLTVVDSVPYTHWGPITFSHDGNHYLHEYAMRWIGHDKQSTEELGTFLELNGANSFEAYFNAVTKFCSPAQNIVYADRDNNIALRISGKIPLRSSGVGEFLSDGSISGNGWQAYVPAEENPMVLNPERGFVSSANQISTDSTYPHPYFGYFADYRGRILNRKLANMSNITIKDMMLLQNNAESILGTEGVAMLLANVKDDIKLSSSAIKKIDLLRNWNGEFNANKVEPVLFYKWFINFYNLAWDEFINDESSLTPEYWRTIELGNHDVAHSYFDIKSTPEIETAETLIIRSLKKMSHEVDSLIDQYADYNWGTFNNNRITHLLGISAFSSDINNVDGFKYALNAVSSTHGPSWRMIVELSDPPVAYGIYPGGQSGHPGHANYSNMIAPWVSGEYNKLNRYTNLKDVDISKGQLIKVTAK